MKKRPAYFLSEDKIDHGGEVFDYIRELHEYCWRFVRATFGPGATGNLHDVIDGAVEQAEFEMAAKHMVHHLMVLGFSATGAREITRGGMTMLEPVNECLLGDNWTKEGQE